VVPEDWTRVASAIKDAQDEVGWLSTELRKRAGVSVETVKELRRGVRDNYTAGVLAKVEAAFGWPEGTIRAVARGAEPPPVDPFRVDRLDTLEATVQEIQRQQQEAGRELGEVRRLLGDLARRLDGGAES
jgi:transcriptional regulator with XRE-family HTH domain